MTDLLKMDFINSLPQPLFGSENGKDWWWPIIDIDVQTGLCRIDVMGKSQVKHFTDFKVIRDDAGIERNIDDFYNEE